MKRLVFVTVVASLAVGCTKKSEKPAAGSASAGSSGSAIAGPPESGSGSGSAGSGADGLGGSAGVAMGSGSAACATVTVTIAKDGATVKRDTEQKVALDALKPALETLAKACIGEVAVVAADDVSYQHVIDAMDRAKAAGFVRMSLKAGDAKDVAGPPPDATPPDVSKAPMVIVTPKEISLVVGQGDRMSMSSAGGLDVVKLEAALKKLPAGTPRVLVLQADASTSAKVINEIVMAAKKADISDVLFAVKNR